MQEFHTMVEAMKDTLASISERKPSTGGYIFGGGGGGDAAGGRGLSGALAGNLLWLLRTAAGYARRSLSQADVAAVFLSRRILLDRSALQGECVQHLHPFMCPVAPAVTQMCCYVH
jgi:hypothetical protein